MCGAAGAQNCRSDVRITAPERAICALVTGPIESIPLPPDPTLAAWASVMNGTGHWATFLDAKWRYAFETDELLSTFADMAWIPTPKGTHFFGIEQVQHILAMRGVA